MNVVVRADASFSIGYGHVMRCLTLAETLRARGHQCLFVCREHPGHLCDVIRERGIAVARLSMRDDSASGSLAADPGQDAQETADAIRNSGVSADWLITDHYGIDRGWQEALRETATRIMAIDDLADRNFDCDALLDQNLVAFMNTRYEHKAPAGCRMLLGPQYALLQPDYAELHERARPRSGAIRRVMIFFSGADVENLTGRSLGAFLRLRRRDIDVDVVVAKGNSHSRAIHDMVARHPNVHLHSTLPTLAPLMAAADLAVGGSGATSWERLCLGLPALVVTMADNQEPVAAELHERGLVRWLGQASTIDDATLEQALSDVLGTDDPGFRMAEAWQLVDGRGANRVCDAIVSMSAPLTPA